MKEMYTKPVVAVEEFMTADVITTSVVVNPGIDNIGGVDDE